MGKGRLAGPLADRSAQRWGVRPHCGHVLPRPSLDLQIGANCWLPSSPFLVGLFSSLDWNQRPWSSVGWELTGFLEKVKMCLVVHLLAGQEHPKGPSGN